MLRAIIPFLNVAYHLASQGIELSPAGGVGTALDVGRGLLDQGPYAGGSLGSLNPSGTGANGAVTPLGQRLRNNAIGLGLAFEGYQQAAQGNITGDGPSDPKEQQTLRETGWQPNSAKIDIAGLGTRYVDLHLLGPVGWSLIQGANAYESG